jgi:hypothetical protein
VGSDGMGWDGCQFLWRLFSYQYWHTSRKWLHTSTIRIQYEQWGVVSLRS